MIDILRNTVAAMLIFIAGIVQPNAAPVKVTPTAIISPTSTPTLTPTPTPVPIVPTAVPTTIPNTQSQSCPEDAPLCNLPLDLKKWLFMRMAEKIIQGNDNSNRINCTTTTDFMGNLQTTCN